MTDQPDHLAVRDLTKRFSRPDGTDLTVLDGVSCTVAKGETVAIVGPSGSGKSTLLNIIGALDTPTSGQVLLGGVDVAALEGSALAHFRASNVGFVFQEHHLLPQLSAVENVLLPTLALDEGAHDESWAREMMERIGLASRIDAFPAQLSGGERQRVALARALVNGAELLLCDEPTGNLDADTGATVVTLLLELAREEGVTVLMVTHNTAHAERFGRGLRLAGGRLVAADAPDRARGTDDAG
jgi:putative ABC transport system ATP-binding protein